MVVFLFGIAVIFVWSSDASKGNGTLFEVHAKTSNALDAVKICNATFGPSWGLPDDTTRQKEFHIFLTENDLTSVWLGIQKTELPKWSWLDNTPYKLGYNMDTGLGDQKEECGGLTIRDMGIIKPVVCSEQNGFVCEMPEGSSCTEPYHRHSCVYSGPKIYIVGCKSKNWYDAREYCMRRGGDLAKLDTNEKISVPVDYIENKRFSGICSWLFIGLRKQSWLYWERNKASNMTGEVSEMPWAHAEPRSGRECVILEENGGATEWRTSRCGDKHYVVCQNYGNISWKLDCEHSNITNEDTKEKISVIGWHIPVIASIVPLPLLFVILCLIYRFRKRIFRMKEKALKEPPTLKPFDGVTVLIFSPGIDKCNDQLKDIDIVHVNLGYRYQWLSISKRSFGTDISIEIAKAFKTIVGDLFKSEKALRIVNVHGIYTGAKLREMIQRFLLESLSEKSDYPVDIIFVPGNNLPVALKDLQALQSLKNKYVCLTSTDREYSRVVSAEMIAVGVSNYASSSITSGVVDFTVDEASCKTCRSLEQGVAVAVGAVAGVLYLIKQKEKENKLQLPTTKTRFMRKLMINLLRGEKTKQSYYGYGVLNMNSFKDNLQESIRKFTDSYKDKRNVIGVSSTAEEEELKTSIKKLAQNFGSTDSRIHVVMATTNLENSQSCNKYNVTIYSGSKAATDYEEPLIINALDLGTSNEALDEFFNAIISLCGSEAEVSKFLKVTVVPVLPNALDFDWNKWLTDMETTIKNVNPDVLFIAPIKSKWPSGMKVQSILRKLKTQCVVFTAAVNIQGPVAPLAFPSDSVIAVGSCDEEAAGSTLDIVACDQFHELSQGDILPKVPKGGDSSDDTTHQNVSQSKKTKKSSKLTLCGAKRKTENSDAEETLVNEADKELVSNQDNAQDKNQKTSQEFEMREISKCNTSNSWAPAMRAMAVTAVTLLKATQEKKQLGLDDEKLNLLKQTTVMRNILVEMCTHPDYHSVHDGFGALHPLKFLGNDENFKLIIEHYTKAENIFDFWSGKNV